MSFNLTTILDDISQGTSYLEYFQLNPGQININFNDEIISFSSVTNSEFIMFLNINSGNLSSTIEVNILKSSSSNPKLYLINSSGSNIAELPFTNGTNVTYTLSDYVSNTVTYNEINFKILETSTSINGTGISLSLFNFNKDGNGIISPPPSPTGPTGPVNCPHDGFASLFPSGNKHAVNIVNHGTEVCIKNNAINFESSCPINHSNNSLLGNMSHHTCAGKVDYFKLYPTVDPLYIATQNLSYYANNSICEETLPEQLNKKLTLGYNVFGQFLVHDMTSNPTSSFDPADISLVNRLTMKLDLDALYGGTSEQFYYNENKFIYNECDNDLPRNHLGKAMIPDPRNDENYLVAQMHLLFMKFHNKLIDFYKPTISKDKLFAFVKKQVIFHYQWLIVNDYLPRTVDNSIIEDLFAGFNFTYKPDEIPKLPLEFAVAVGRTGHFIMPNSIRIAYDLIVDENEIHHFTGGKLPEYVIDWTNFFPMKYKEYDINFCRKYDGSISTGLANMTHLSKPKNLPCSKNNLLLRNLMRAQQFELGSGQDYAQILGINQIPDILLKQYDNGCILELSHMLNETPLILYAVKEAEIYKNGCVLTGVGGRIFAETILALLFKDCCSYLNTPCVWKPIMCNSNNSFTFADMINFIHT